MLQNDEIFYFATKVRVSLRHGPQAWGRLLRVLRTQKDYIWTYASMRKFFIGIFVFTLKYLPRASNSFFKSTYIKQVSFAIGQVCFQEDFSQSDRRKIAKKFFKSSNDPIARPKNFWLGSDPYNTSIYLPLEPQPRNFASHLNTGRNVTKNGSCDSKVWGCGSTGSQTEVSQVEDPHQNFLGRAFGSLKDVKKISAVFRRSDLLQAVESKKESVLRPIFG